MKARLTDCRVACFDPGLMTGLATCNVKDSRIVSYGSEEMTIEEVWAWTKTEMSLFTHIAVERFTINVSTAKKTAAPWSLELKGYLQGEAWHFGLNEEAGTFELQAPADAMAFASNDRLREWELWHRGGAGHAKDAARHLAYFLTNHGLYGALQLRRDEARAPGNSPKNSQTVLALGDET